MKKILTIAGSDTSGGAGIQAELRTYAKYNLYAMSVLTVIVTMDPDNNWAHSVHPISMDTIRQQMATAMHGVGVDTIKTGMLPTIEIIEYTSQQLAGYHGKLPIVIDPVMVCKGDKPLFPEHGYALKTELIKYATVATPNLFEAAQLADMNKLTSLTDAKKAAEKIIEAGAQSVVIKGVGTISDGSSSDLFFDGKEFTSIDGPMINTDNTHGLGCTYAAHIAAQLCLGATPKEAVIKSKEKITKGLKYSFKINKFVGTLDFGKSFE